MKEDPALGKVQRRAIAYGLKKATLSDVDFNNEQQSVSDVLVGRIRTKLEAAAQPSMTPFLIVAGLQIAVLILAIIYNHQ
jgi:hypothetical protein